MRNFFNAVINFFDPYRRSFLFTRYGIAGFIFIALLSYLFFLWLRQPGTTLLGPIGGLFSIGVHEVGHPVFRMISGGNHFMTIIGGTAMELLVPLLSFLYFTRKGWEIQADVCLLLLSLAFKSVGNYAGYSQDAFVLLINADESTIPDWDYMHQWFNTVGHEALVRQIFYGLSAFTAALALWLVLSHIRRWFKEPLHAPNAPPAI